ncbi:MAG: DinB family protein, partial [Marivirga sp.]|nr:DinB family protein [Marivirga sp.]
MTKLNWFDRDFKFGLPLGMLPFYLERLQGTIARVEMKVKGIPDEILSNKFDGKWS